jgi:sulfate/thiosulfate transport system permease protein
MSGFVSSLNRPAPSQAPTSIDSHWTRWLLIACALSFLGLFLLVPMGVVFVSAFAKGFDVYLAAIRHPETFTAMRLTLLTALISVPLNTVFGVGAAWLISKYDFPGKSLLITLIDLPFSVSPVVAGLLFVLLFGSRGWFAPWLQAADFKVIFAFPGIALATTFITFPLVAREAMAVMQAQGNDEEEAALTMSASAWQIFWRVTLPKIRWGLLYGVILCNARAMGEFGAVSVVSGHIRGETNTLPLHIEILYGEYQFAAAFAVASLLTLLAVTTLALKHWVEWQSQRRPAIDVMGSAQSAALPAVRALPLRAQDGSRWLRKEEATAQPARSI